MSYMFETTYSIITLDFIFSKGPARMVAVVFHALLSSFSSVNSRDPAVLNHSHQRTPSNTHIIPTPVKSIEGWH